MNKQSEEWVEIGNVNAPDWRWDDGPLVGRLVSVDMVTTRYGDRARVTLSDGAALAGAWMPARWVAILSDHVGRDVRIARVRSDRGQVRYDVAVRR